MADRSVATAMIYSGRPDPEWRLRDSQVERLRRVWERLTPGRSATPHAPALGYRGVAVRCASGEKWFAYGGVVTLTHASGVVEPRNDDERRFEETLLATAPKGIVPRGAPLDR